MSRLRLRSAFPGSRASGRLLSIKSFAVSSALLLAVAVLLGGCPSSRAFVSVSIQTDQEAPGLEVNFDGVATAAPPFTLDLEPTDASEKLLASEPETPCPVVENDPVTIPLNVVEWFWDFGGCCGNATALGQHATFVYPESGCYVVTLVVTLSDGEMITTQEDLCLQP